MLNDLRKKDFDAQDHVKQIENILSKPLSERSNVENHELGNLISNIKFFKDKSELNRNDIQEIASALQFQ